MTECIPHHYIIDEYNHGVCQKCQAEKQFPKWDDVAPAWETKSGHKQISIAPRRPGTSDIFSGMGKRHIHR